MSPATTEDPRSGTPADPGADASSAAGVGTGPSDRHRLPLGGARRRSARPRHPRPHRLRHDPQGVACVRARGHLVHHLEQLGPRGQPLRGPGVRLRHAAVVADRADPGGPGEHRHRPVHQRDGVGPVPPGGHLHRRPARRDPVGGLRPVGRAGVRAEHPAVLRQPPQLVRRRADRGLDPRPEHQRPDLPHRRHHPRHHDHADHHLAQPRGRGDHAPTRCGRPPTAWAPPAGR